MSFSLRPAEVLASLLIIPAIIKRLANTSAGLSEKDRTDRDLVV